MYEKKPRPPLPNRTHNRCPVCDEISYSRAGIHPQCSARRADEERKKRIKLEDQSAEAKKMTTPASGAAPWQKYCPKCKALQHVRKAVCACGHHFAAKARPPTSEGNRT
jgi:hypothetical protein